MHRRFARAHVPDGDGIRSNLAMLRTATSRRSISRMSFLSGSRHCRYRVAKVCGFRFGMQRRAHFSRLVTVISVYVNIGTAKHPEQAT